MADAQKVVEVVEAEIRLLEETGGKEEQLEPLRELVTRAKAAGSGAIPDADVLASGLHPSQSRKLVS